MQSYLSLVLLTLLAAINVNAHFQLQFPAPRGVFDEDNEPTFCDGYLTPAENRTSFPLTGGVFSLNSEHPKWTAGVLISTVSNPTSFDNFTQIVPYFEENGEGKFCFPLDLAQASNVSSLQSGQNVTIQIVFDGGDGQLYQCADLTLSNDASVSNVSCTNATASTTSTATTSTSSSTAPATTSSSAANANGVTTAAGVMGLFLSALGAGLAVL